MDLQHKEDIQKKQKKKKHNRSRSRSEHKKHKRSRSRSQHKKDKKKKQKSSYDRHHRHRSTSRDKSNTKLQKVSSHRQKQQEKQEKSKHRQNDKEQKHKDKNQNITTEQQEKHRKDDTNKSKTYDIENKKDREREQRKQKDKQRDHKQKADKQKSKQRSSIKQERNQKPSADQHDRRHRQQRRDKDQRKDKEQRRDKQQRRDKDRRERSYQRDRYRQGSSRYDRNDKVDRYDSRRRQRERQTFRSRSQQKRQRSPERNDRFATKRRSRSKQNRDDRRRPDKRRENNRFDMGRFRFDSPPKSDESDMSDDPQKMDKLNRMKAEKQLVTSKADRKLYLGNLPPNITSQQLMDMLNAALKKMEINTDCEGDSIISAWISPDGVGHYAFVEFRTAQQATNGLALNGASLFGYQLKLGRPKQYIEYNKQLLSKFGTDSSIDTIIKKVEAMGGQITMEVTEKIICPPSRILVMKHIVTVEQLAIDEEFHQIHDDVLDMAKRYGEVIKVVIPRPHEVFNLQEVKTRVKGLGLIFVEYKTVQQAIFARKQFVQKQFSGRSVACSFFDQKRFRQGQYDISEKVVIDF